MLAWESCMGRRFLFLLVSVPVWCMDVCRNVDSFPFRQIFAPPICPTFRKGHAEFFRRPCMCVCVCIRCGFLLTYSLSFALYVHIAQATMVVSMREGRVTRHKKDAK